MALSIKNAHTEQLARELAAATGQSITEAVETALVERLARIRARYSDEATRVDVDDIVRRVHKLRIKDRRTADEILGYDDAGIPT